MKQREIEEVVISFVGLVGMLILFGIAYSIDYLVLYFKQ